MSQQPDLFGQAPDTSRPHKAGRVVRTSVAAYLERPRNERAAAVVRALEWVGGPSTSAELAKDMCDEDGVRYELSRLLAVRRGLSDARKLGLVEHAGARKCAISGRVCKTWKVRTR